MSSKLDYLKRYASKDEINSKKVRKKRKLDASSSMAKGDRHTDESKRQEEIRKQLDRKHEEIAARAEAENEDAKKEPLEEIRRSGLFTGEEFAQQQKRLREQEASNHASNSRDSGEKAETIYRDKKGKKLDMLNEMMRQQAIQEGKLKKKKEEEYEWGTGRVQKQEHLDKLQEYEDAKFMPFARYQTDDKLEKMLKERMRDGDPMAAYLAKEKNQKAKKHKKDKKKSKKKKRKSSTHSDSDQSDKRSERLSRKVYTGPEGPPNRFGIRPGYRWDGVVRGNGWEAKIAMKANSAAATSEEAYMYSTADM